MIILDTNVVSEPMKRNGSIAVQTWLDRQVAETLYLTTINLAELLTGLEILPNGRRKKGLKTALTELITQLFGSRILPFDREAAETYAALVGHARASGYALSVADAQIAAIATVHGYTVATRDTTPFAVADVPVINPWETD
ncbi:MAG TPA: type II toxin-antitoxin system VapC family toxin [Gammaproteobacteria bacterium]|nr:type II toxin-antitoxin system VapC family toxin [Gammaproteobacteria bacterium]